MIAQLKQVLGVTAEELKQPTILKSRGDVFYLLLNTKANAFSRPFVRDIHRQLDLVEAHAGPTALVTVSLSKLFSGGLDLKVISNLEPEDQEYSTLEFIRLLGRVAVLPLPTLSLVRGGAVAGGCMFAFAHDYVYVAEKALFSTKEAQLQMFFPPGMLSIVRKRHPYPSVLRDMVVFAKEFSPEEALQHTLIDGIWSEGEALEKAQARAEELSEYGDNKDNMRKIKSELYRNVTECCFNKQVPANRTTYARFPPFPKL
jgi:Delta3-Delta2-enoyl-CoA isomerase